jgi:hypothetical protein
MNMEQMVEWYFAGETEVLRENLPSATSSTTNPTWIDPGANPGLRGERPATNRLSHGTALRIDTNTSNFLLIQYVSLNLGSEVMTVPLLFVLCSCLSVT